MKNDLKDYYGAISDYTKAIEINPRYVSAYHNRGVAKEYLQDYEGALKDYEKATKIDSDDYLAWSGVGNMKIKLENWLNIYLI